MKTDDLIAALSHDPAPAPTAPPRQRLLVAIGIGLAIALVLTVTFLQVRPDIGTAMMPVMWKAGFSALAAGAALPLLMRLARPGRPMGWRMLAVFGFVGVSAMVAVVALMGGDPSQRMSLWMGGSFPWCIVTIPLLAAPTAALLAWVLRDLAPTRLASSGAALGAVSGGIGAMAYAMYCPVDSVAFVTTWYAVAIALCAALGAILGTRLLRW
jgi:hypothetical protein